MALSKFSTPFQVTQPVSPVDMQLLDNTLGYKQAKYDEGYLAISKSLQAYNSLDLIRPEDIEYKNRKVEALTEQLNSYGSVDLSDPKEVIKLQMQASSLAEDKDLIGRVQSTKNYRQLVDRYSKMKENPKLMPYYSYINEKRDMKEASQWLNGQAINFSKSSPTLYTDSDKIIGEQLNKLAPKKSTTQQGMYLVNNETRSEGDLKQLAKSQILGNAQVQSQLYRNALDVFEGQSDQDVRATAVRTTQEEIDDVKRSVQLYQTRLKDASITKEEKAVLQSRISELDGVRDQQGNVVQKGAIQLAEDGIADINNKSVDDLKFQIYTKNYVDSIVRPYIVDNQKVSPNQVAIYQDKSLRDDQREVLRMQFTSRENELKRQDERLANLNKYEFEASKIGQTVDRNLLLNTGELRMSGTGAGNYFQQPIVQKDNTDIDAFAEINTKSDQFKSTNKALVSQLTQEILEETDRDLLSKIKPLLDQGNLFDNKTGKFLGNSQGMSPAQIEILQQYDKLLDNATDPNTIETNPLLSKHASIRNKMLENQLAWTALDDEKSKAEKQVFDDAHKNGEFKGNWKEWQSLLKGELKATTKESPKDYYSPITGDFIPGGLTFPNKFLKRVNEKLHASPHKNEFYTARYINPGDKSFNDPDNVSGKYSMVQDFAFNKGVIIDGQGSSLNGRIVSDKSYRNDLSNVSSIQVDKIIPNTNQIEVSVMVKENPDKKDLTPKKAILQLNPDEMKAITGTSGSELTTNNFVSTLRNGKMEDQFGNPKYFNLAGDIPDMIGNLQYRLWNYDSDGTMIMSLRVPVNGKPIEVNIPKSEANFKNLGQAKSWVTQNYMKVFQSVQATNPSLSQEEVSKLTLDAIYKAYK